MPLIAGFWNYGFKICFDRSIEGSCALSRVYGIEMMVQFPDIVIYGKMFLCVDAIPEKLRDIAFPGLRGGKPTAHGLCGCKKEKGRAIRIT